MSQGRGILFVTSMSQEESSSFLPSLLPSLLPPGEATAETIQHLLAGSEEG